MNNNEAVVVLREALQAMLERYPYKKDEEEKPKTFGCHHFVETCSLCEALVSSWKAARLAVSALAATASIADGREGQCNHRVADARNPVITSGYICVDCGALFAAADHERAATAAKDAAQKPADYYTCIGKGGLYVHVGVASGAGDMKGSMIHVYRDTRSGNLFARTPMDFDNRMRQVAAPISEGSALKDKAEPFTIYANGKPIDVAEHYMRAHKMGLPATPTMCGQEIKDAVDAAIDQQLFQENNENRPDNAVGASEAIPLSRGMKFYTVPPATYAAPQQEAKAEQAGLRPITEKEMMQRQIDNLKLHIETYYPDSMPAAPESKGEAGELPPLPEALEICWPEMHCQALGCGVEDRGITDRYEAAQYGFQDGVDKSAECVPEDLFDSDLMRAYGQACYAAGQSDAVAASGAGVPVLTDTMIDAYMTFMRKASYLRHPDVPYHGTAHGDSEDGWNRRLTTKALAVTLAAAPTPDRAAKECGLLKEALAWIENSKEPAPSLCGDIRTFLGLPSQPTKSIEPQSGMLFEALNDMARIRNEHDENVALSVNIDRQIKNVEEQLRKRKDRRLLQIDVEFERRVNSEDRRANARKQFKEE